MQLTRHTDYALRILIYLGARTLAPVSVNEIAEYFAISRHHLVKIVQQLTAHGYVLTTRGKHGGMQLAKPAEKISVGGVIRRLENFHVVECFDDTAPACMLDGNCYLKVALHRASKNFLKELDGVYLSDVLKPRLRSQLLNITDRPGSAH